MQHLALDEPSAWAAANAASLGGSHEAISRVEAIGTALHLAEARARADEEEWNAEEARLEQEESVRRTCREAHMAEEEQRAADDWDAEQRRVLLGRPLLGEEHSPPSAQRSTEAPITDAIHGGNVSTTEEVDEAMQEVVQRDRTCFECDAALDSLDPEERLWLSVSHGLLLCERCGHALAALGQTACSLKVCDGSLRLDELNSLFAGGSEAFASYLSEEMGIARRVWRALPLEMRYHTPAAELYVRRLRAFMAGEVLPTNLQRVMPPAPQEMLSSKRLSRETSGASTSSTSHTHPPP
jgi:hypothetical protein